MTRKLPIQLLLILGLTVLCVLSLSAQTPTSDVFRIKLSDNAAPGDSGLMVFGNHVSATYNIDAALGENASPPDPPGFYTKWISIPGRPTFSSTGLLYKDLRDAPGTLPSTRKDTFYIRVKNDDGSAAPANLTVTWPAASYITDRCDSMIMIFSDPLGMSGVPGGRVNMTSANSVTILTPFDQSGDGVAGWNPSAPYLTLKIYKYGVKDPLLDAVRKESNAIPAGFALHQNYPNPFNPTTNFTFDVRNQGLTEIAIYNMLGQKVSTLVSKDLTPGSYSTTWNGTNDDGIAVTSGVYFVRMSVRADGVNDFSAVRKMVLMK
ncbi:MAG: T9SS type A sorting domain-containing protein [Ignavibacteriae bacterium]|nr:T9SS type A sorting domain-containing protein [Ignavibacteria bacterium]MBI3363919.1 T9SS type A sorting domain-containing protein [Ignavibacteriota bacterium]